MMLAVAPVSWMDEVDSAGVVGEGKNRAFKQQSQESPGQGSSWPWAGLSVIYLCSLLVPGLVKPYAVMVCVWATTGLLKKFAWNTRSRRSRGMRWGRSRSLWSWVTRYVRARFGESALGLLISNCWSTSGSKLCLTYWDMYSCIKPTWWRQYQLLRGLYWQFS